MAPPIRPIVANRTVCRIASDRNSGTISHGYNIVYGNTIASYEGTIARFSEIGSDLLFVGGGDHHLDTGSPAIDSGTDASAVTSTDCDCGARPVGPGWDMGYDEFNSVATSHSVVWKQQP